MFARRTAIVLLALSALPALSQSSVAPKEDLARLVPAESMFYVERAGHDAVKDVFAASNLGEMYKDPAINAFVNETRVQIGKLIVKGMFDLQADKDIDRNQELLHQFLKPWWYKPAALFLLPATHVEGGTDPFSSAGFICVVPQADRKEPQAALETLMKIGVPEKGAGERQAFVYTSGKLTWSGVAKSSHDEFTLPTEVGKLKDALKGKSLFLTCWTQKYLLVATSLEAAEAMDKTVAGPKGLAGDANFATVMKKTELKDWAFRWYLSPSAIGKMMDKDTIVEMKRTLNPLGLGKVEGIGGTGGYDKNVFVRRTYILSPNTETGLLRFFKSGESYKPAFAMMPQGATVVLAGRVDLPAMLKLYTRMIKGELATSGPADDEKNWTAQEKKGFKALNDLAAASDGNVGVYLGKVDMSAMMGIPPMGMVVGIKDKDKANRVLAEFKQLAGVETQPTTDAAEEETPSGEKVPKVYRNVAIHPLGNNIMVALMDDRMIISPTPRGLKLAIDVAMDKKGGFAKDSKGEKYLTVAGDGSGMFYVDLGVLAKAFWPMLIQAREASKTMGPGGDIIIGGLPLGTLPETEVLTKYLGPELAVFENDKDGLLLKSSGLVPLVTKLVPAYGAMGGFFMYAFASHSSHTSSPATKDLEEALPPAPSSQPADNEKF